MKKILAALCLLFFAKVGNAQGAQIVREVAQSTNTIVQTINLCQTDGAVDPTSLTSSGTVPGYWAVEVYNPVASTTTVNAGFDVSLSSNINSACLIISSIVLAATE